MSRWKELPDPLDQRVRQLVVQLRRLKDRSGLSLDVLAVKTGYSRSSWDRYLNGKALPPRHAVEELARVAGADPVRLLVLHEVAEEAWPQRITSSSSAAAKDGGEQGAPGEKAAELSVAAEGSAASAERPGASEKGPTVLGAGPGLGAGQPPGVRWPVALAAVVAAALVGMAAGLLIAAPWGDDDGGGDKVQTALNGPLPNSSTTSTGAATGTGTSTGSGTNSNNTSTEGLGWYVFKPDKSYSCKVHRTGEAGEAGEAGGALFAGYSKTRTAVLAGPGWDVVEAQCLLGYLHLEPGIVDGVYGQQTIAAVMRLQKKAGLPADGVVGPHTWQALRG